MTIPSVAQQAATDAVRAREDCRGDLMTVRHRISKLLLRQGIVYSGGQAWTGKHELWLRGQHFDAPGLQLAFDAAFDAMVACVHRRNRLDEAITAMAELGIDISNQHSKTTADLGGQRFDYAVTVCQEATEACPYYPNAVHQVHWGFDDPAAATGTEEERLAVFRRVRDEIAASIDEFVSAANP